MQNRQMLLIFAHVGISRQYFPAVKFNSQKKFMRDHQLFLK